MSFGFPAYHTEKVILEGDPELLWAKIKSCLEDLHWPMELENEVTIVANTHSGGHKYGMRVVIQRDNESHYTITSRYAIMTQCLDWGKNKQNVKTLLASINRN